jgi:hypothetical protein
MMQIIKTAIDGVSNRPTSTVKLSKGIRNKPTKNNFSGNVSEDGLFIKNQA